MSSSYPAIAIDEKATDVQSILKIIHQYPITAVVVKPFRLGYRILMNNFQN
jgi:O-succinylbenzoate synthase